MDDDLILRGIDKQSTLLKLQLIFSNITKPISYRNAVIRKKTEGIYVLTCLLDLNNHLLPDSLFFKKQDQAYLITGSRERIFGDFFYSEILGRLTRFGVFLPPDYRRDRNYPVIVNLLGFSEAFSGWIRPDITRICDVEILEGRICSYIGISPQGKRCGLWMNWPDGINRTEDVILTELIPHIDAIYPTYGTGDKRAIQGLSNGGYGAFSYALSHPGLFCAAVSYSGPLAAKHPLYPALSPIYLAETLSNFPQIALFFTVGDQDELKMNKQADRMHTILNRKNIQHVYKQFKGGHHHNEWLQHLPLGLGFISKAFSQ